MFHFGPVYRVHVPMYVSFALILHAQRLYAFAKFIQYFIIEYIRLHRDKGQTIHSLFIHTRIQTHTYIFRIQTGNYINMINGFHLLLFAVTYSIQSIVLLFVQLLFLSLCFPPFRLVLCGHAHALI